MSKLRMLDPFKVRGLKMAEPLVPTIKAPRAKHRKADNGRVLPLNGAAWAKLRAQVLADEPLCRCCLSQGQIVPATEVDHMNGAGDNRRESLQSLCKSCHSLKTNAELHGREARMGCDTTGAPINPSHHWNQSPAGPSDGSGEAVCAEKSRGADGYEPTSPPFLIADCHKKRHSP